MNTTQIATLAWATCVAVFVGFSEPALAQSAPPAPICAVVVGGKSMTFADKRVEAVWFNAQEAAFAGLINTLGADNYAVYADFDRASYDTNDGHYRNAVMIMRKLGCTKLVKITNGLKNEPRSFIFTVTVFRFETATVNAGMTYKAVNDFSKTLEYALNEETMKSVKMNDVGIALAKAVEDSGSLADARRPAAQSQPKVAVPVQH